MKRWIFRAIVPVLVSSLSAMALDSLPIKKVALFTSGVGYFERVGEVRDDQGVELQFTTEQMVDVVKSLVAIDEGKGRVCAVVYEARDPLDRVLKSFAVDLTGNPSLPELLNRLRGIELILTTAKGEERGTLTGVETEAAKEGDLTISRHWLRLYAGGEIRSISLDQIQSLRFADAKLDAELQKALGALASNLGRDKKALKLDFRGKGARIIRVGYVIESPVWKTSYRLVLGEKNALLQGWAHVENTSDEDWQKVQLTLTSGRPSSFIQNLYDPIYVRRPEVRPETYVASPPPVYESAMQALPLEAREGEDLERPLLMKGLYAGRAAPKAAAPRAPRPGVHLEELEPSVSVEAAAQELGELYVYSFENIDLPRRQSAMLPIVNVEVPAQKLSIYNRSVNVRHPYNGVELTNNTGLFWMQGPVTVYEEGNYAGDARLGDTANGETKMLSYGIDLASEIRVDEKYSRDEIASLKIERGVLRLVRKHESRTEYTVKNKRDRERRYVIEHRLRSDWDLVEPSKDIEKTSDHYRYRFSVAAGRTVTVPFVEQRSVSETVGLIGTDASQIEFYLTQKRISASVRKALEKLASLQREVAEIRQQKEDLERKIREAREEQTRIRQNMQAVIRPSDSYSMWERKLVSQEKELESLLQQAESVRERLRQKESELADYVANLSVE